MQVAFSTSDTGFRDATKTVMRGSVCVFRRLAEPRRWWIGLTMLALSVVAAPVAAQSGSEAVVCVGSARRTLATNPIHRVYTEDMELVYRVRVDLGQCGQVDRDLSSELGSYPEVWCAWSDPKDDHAVIIGYTGVIRQDLTVDPENPRFQAFSVGFGPDFDAADTQATTIDQRFRSRNDGGGYEFLPRETWGAAEGVVGEAASRVQSAGWADLPGESVLGGLLDGNRQPPGMLPVESRVAGGVFARSPPGVCAVTPRRQHATEETAWREAACEG